jgi:hypothetical protein
MGAVLLLVAAGCSRSHERSEVTDAAVVVPPDAFHVPPDAHVAPDAFVASFVIAEHGPGAVVPDQGGPRMTHPQLVVITFADDENRAVLEANARWLVTSRWLASTGAEYGIGAGSILGLVERTDAAPDVVTGTEVEAMIATGVADGSLPVPPDGRLDEVLYLIYFPRHTTITDERFGSSCEAYGGYHYESPNGGRPFAFAVIPSCDAFGAELSSLEFQEETVAHEVFEAATDRLPETNPAFRFSETGFAYSPWLFIGGEIADLCELRVGAREVVREDGFVATRIWSNEAARLNDRDPCVPADPAVPYYTVSISPDRAVALAAGESTTFDVAAWSTAPVADFELEAAPAGGSTLEGTFTADAFVDRTIVNNGDHATLTVSVPPGTPSNAYAIVYVAVIRDATEYSYLPVVVYVP